MTLRPTTVLAQLVAAAVIAAACAPGPTSDPTAAPAPSAPATVDPEDADCEDGVFYWIEGCTPASSVDLSTIVSGGPPPDGIAPIDEPAFDTVRQAGEWLTDLSPVQVVTVGGETKAYPLAILTWHEIVNDQLAGEPIVVTYCPLCNSGLVFERTVRPADGGPPQVLDFGTSGRLRLSNLVMYDRQHRNLWQQFNGEAIVGTRFLGQRLERIPSQLIGYGELRETAPDAAVLSPDTGFGRDYGRNPYIAYDDVSSTPFLYRGPKDERLAQMERVVGLGVDDDPVAIVLDHLAEQRVVRATVDGEPVVLFWAPGQASALDTARIDQGRDVGQTGAFRPFLDDGTELRFTPGADARTFIDEDTGSVWNLLGRAIDGPLAGERLDPVAHDDTFWFVWFAFQPETRLVGAAE